MAEYGFSKRITDRQRRPDSADENILIFAAKDNEAARHDVVTCLRETAYGDVRRPAGSHITRSGKIALSIADGVAQ